MPYEFKVFLTVGTAVGILLIQFALTPGHKDDGRWWRGGKRDPFYRLLYTPEGTFRKQAKGLLIGGVIILNILLWSVL